MKEAEHAADSFARKCESERALRAHADALRKEIVKLEQAWTRAIEEVLGKDRDAGDTSVASDKPSVNGTILPVQVAGFRWFCASVRGGTHHGDIEEKCPAVRHLGPLRPTTDEAAGDLQCMRAKLGLEEAEVEPTAAKRHRVTSKEST